DKKRTSGSAQPGARGLEAERDSDSADPQQVRIPTGGAQTVRTPRAVDQLLTSQLQERKLPHGLQRCQTRGVEAVRQGEHAILPGRIVDGRDRSIGRWGHWTVGSGMAGRPGRSEALEL